MAAGNRGSKGRRWHQRQRQAMVAGNRGEQQRQEMAAGNKGERWQAMAAGNRGGVTATGDGNDSKSNIQKGHKQAYLSKTRCLWARLAIGAGGEEVERLRQP